MNLLLSHYNRRQLSGRRTRCHLAGTAGTAQRTQACDFETVTLNTWIGEVPGVDAVTLPAALRAFDCRNNRSGFSGSAAGRLRAGGAAGSATVWRQAHRYFSGHQHLRHAADRIGATVSAKVGEARCRPGSTTTKTQNTYSVAGFVRKYFGLDGPAVVVSTACSSSSKVFANAQRMMDCGLIDAAIVGGVDSLCLTTLYGFHSLQLLSERPCAPYGADRNGISIGEAAAFALLTRAPEQPPAGAVLLRGVGESSDAHHMSSPHPQGLGAQLAMRSALQAAGPGHLTDRLREPARHGHAEQRCRRGQRRVRGAGHKRPLQLDQGPHRPYPGRKLADWKP